MKTKTGCIKLIKSNRKCIYNVTKVYSVEFLFQINGFERSIHQRILKKESVSTKIWSSSTIFDIDNKKSAYYNDFWRSCDTEDWSNDAENTALITEINYMLKYITIEMLYCKS